MELDVFSIVASSKNGGSPEREIVELRPKDVGLPKYGSFTATMCEAEKLGVTG
jgi:hypothetical protein